MQLDIYTAEYSTDDYYKQDIYGIIYGVPLWEYQ